MSGKNILLCVSGGIASYKSADLTSKLVQAGYHVKVIMSGSAVEFVSPLTFQALSRNEVYTNTFIENNPSVIAHIDAADWADLVLVAPATANTIAKLASGIADDMLTTTLLATTASIWVAPAMNVHMYDHPAVKQNLETLKEYGYRLLEPTAGYLACGYVGKGRMEEPEIIVDMVQSHFEERALLEGKTVLVTAGPTKEKLDPVRYFTNRSSGKMGYALAGQAAKFGADVLLVSGTDSLQVPPGVEMIPVQTAEDMYQAVTKHAGSADIIIKSAAVADYRPKIIHDQKMKKSPGSMIVEFERTRDILAELGKQKKGQFLVGFAAETHEVERYAKDKLERKNADMMIANNVSEKGAGFGGDTNKVTIYHRDGTSKPLPMLSKQDTARAILMEIAERTGVDKDS